jgi:hypothetical protein
MGKVDMLVKAKKYLMALSLAAVTAHSAQAAEQQTLCVFDVIGANGPLFNMMKDFKASALEWDVDLKLRAYTDEKIASDDFKAGQCDGVLLTGVRARPYNKFTATIEAIGAIPDYKVLKTVLQTISSPKAARYMKEGNYEIAGIMPAGGIYVFVRDREIDTVAELSGKRIATIDYDEASIKMVNHIGATVVPSNSANFSGKFNNGSVDVAYAPAVAYKPLEMYKGLENGGGIINYILAHMDFQLVIHADRFPAHFAQNSRSLMATNYEKALAFVDEETDKIDKKYWINLPTEYTVQYDGMLRDVRIALRDEGVYSGKMLTLLRKIRCSGNPAAAECTEKLE